MPLVPVLLDLLMATMDSPRVWSAAAGDPDAGLAWRDAVTDRMIEAGDYIGYDRLIADAATQLRLPLDASARLRAAWEQMAPWPDATAVRGLRSAYAFVTNCSTELAAVAVLRSGLQPVFVLSAEAAGCYKPRAEIYRLACDLLGSDPSETTFVAGAAYDARGAARAGLRAILVRRRLTGDALPAGIPIVPSLDEALAGL